MNYKYTKYIPLILIIMISIFGMGISGLMTIHDSIQYFINILLVISIAINIKVRDQLFNSKKRGELYPDYSRNKV